MKTLLAVPPPYAPAPRRSTGHRSLDLGRPLGVDDEELIGRLIELKISPETAAAMMLVPLVEVAWADGDLADKERTAVLDAAAQEGITRGTPAHAQLSQWLRRRPGPELFEAWSDYIAELTDDLTESERHTLHEICMGRARQVAEAAGGFLGLAKISAKEVEMLDRLDSAFHAS